MSISRVSETDRVLSERYPSEIAVGNLELTVTPMVPSDWALLEDFLTGVPDEERLFLRRDLTDPERVEHWCQDLDYDHTLPLLAWHGGRIACDATLHREPGLWTGHVGRLRLTVHPDFRGRGLGRTMVMEVLDVARDLGLHKVITEYSADQPILNDLMAECGFGESARLENFVRDRDDRFHDMLLMVHDLQ